MAFIKSFFSLLTIAVIAAQNYPGLQKLVCGAGEGSNV